MKEIFNTKNVIPGYCSTLKHSIFIFCVFVLVPVVLFAVEPPTNIYFDEVSSTTIVASGYAATPAFTGLETGLAGVNVAKDGVYSVWRNGNKWTAKTVLPTARNLIATGVMGGKVYAVGGYTPGYEMGTNEEYDPVLNTWITKAIMPTIRRQLAAGAIDGKLYVVGGWDGSYLSTNEEYDPTTNTWITKAAMPTSRLALSAGVVEGKLYAVGGWNGGVLNTNEEYDPATDTWTTRAAMPTSRREFSIGVASGKLYMVGGYNGASELTTNEEYNPAANTWATKAAIPTGRRMLSAGVAGGKIYFIGGYDGVSYLDTNEEYDPAVNTWVTKAAMPTPRREFSIGAVGGKLYAIGGMNGSVLGVNEAYDPGVTYVFASLTPNTQYSFKAKARDAVGAETAEGPTVSTYTLAAPPAPAGTVFTSVLATAFDVNWLANSNPSGTLYRAQVSTAASFSTVLTSDTYNTAAGFTGLTAGIQYYARVSARNDGGAWTANVNLGAVGSNLPVLSWTGETDYVSDGISPDTGGGATVFTYRVKYTDPDNDAPLAGYPRVHIKKNGAEITGSPYVMSWVSGAYSAGAVYTYSKILSISGVDYAFHFDAKDASGSSATGAPTGTSDSPDVFAQAPGDSKVTLGNNLFSPRTGGTCKVKFSVPASGQVSLKIFDMSGIFVKTLFDGIAGAGDIQRDWDGKDEIGLHVVPGVYFLVYEYPGGTEVRKIGVKK